MHFSRKSQTACALVSNETKFDKSFLRNYNAHGKYNDLYTCDECETKLHGHSFPAPQYLICGGCARDQIAPAP